MTPRAASETALTTRRKIVFACAAFALVGMFAIAALFALDLYVHYRVQRLDLNVWGYRGPAVGRKQPGELRITTLGGSTVFGYGVGWMESWPYLLERRINQQRPNRGSMRVVNLGMPRDSATTFVTTMDDYDYLQPDVVILYEGYNDLEPPKSEQDGSRQPTHYLTWRHQSPIFRWTGYLPLVPLVLREKALAMMHGGDVNAAYGSREIVFRPGLATRVTAGALQATADIETALERRFGRLTDRGAPPAPSDSTCGRWSEYCGAIRDAVHAARRRGRAVVVVTQPYLSDLHVEQQEALAAGLRREFAGDRGVRYVNLGRLIDLHDHDLAYDGVHLTKMGNDRIAEALAPVVLEVNP